MSAQYDIDGRIERIERDNRRLTLAVVAMAVLACVVLVMGAAPQTGVYKSLQASSIEVVNDKGDTVVSIGATDDGGGRIDLYDKDGASVISMVGDTDPQMLIAKGGKWPRVGIGASTDFAGVTVSQSKKGGSATLSFESGTSRLNLSGPDGKKCIDMYVGNDLGSEISLGNGDGTNRWALNDRPNGEVSMRFFAGDSVPLGMEVDKDGLPRITLRDTSDRDRLRIDVAKSGCPAIGLFGSEPADDKDCLKAALYVDKEDNGVLGVFGKGGLAGYVFPTEKMDDTDEKEK